MTKSKILSIDAETDGLWGDPFAVAAISYEKKIGASKLYTAHHSNRSHGAYEFVRAAEQREAEQFGINKPWAGGSHTSHIIRADVEWVETARIILRLPNSFVTDDWVIENVLPELDSVPVTHRDYEAMLKDFAAFYLNHKDEADIICHMGTIVEAHLLREMHRISAIGDWDAPFPMIDIAGNLQQAGENPKSVDKYNQKYGVTISNQYGRTHNPLFDCEAAARAYIHLRKV